MIISEYKNKTDLSINEIEALIMALCYRGWCYFEIGRKTDDQDLRFSEAEEDFKSAIKVARAFGFPAPIRAYNGLGFVFENSKKISMAKAAYIRVLKMNPQNRRALHGLDRIENHRFSSE